MDVIACIPVASHADQCLLFPHAPGADLIHRERFICCDRKPVRNDATGEGAASTELALHGNIGERIDQQSIREMEPEPIVEEDPSVVVIPSGILG